MYIVIAILVAAAIGAVVVAIRSRDEDSAAPSGTGGPRSGADTGNPQNR